MMNMLLQGFLVRMVNDPKTHLTAFTPNRSDHGGPIILICAMSALFVGTATRRIAWIKVFVTFFPQHSETFHPFQYADRGAGCPVGLSRRWLAPHGVKSTPCHSLILVRRTAPSNSLLCICRAHQHNHLHGRQVALLENRPTIQVIGHLTWIASIDHQLAAPGPPKDPGLGIRRSAFRTVETHRVKVLCDPFHTACVI